MKKILSLLLAAVFMLLVYGCDKTPGINAGMGRLSIKITDDPFDIEMIESATVTINKVEIRKTGDDEGNPFMVLSEDTVTLDLIDLRNGVMANLLDIEVPSGDYDLVRLYVTDASLTVKGYTESFNVKVPSGAQTGIKIFIEPELRVSGGLTTELLLDFDLSKSFVIRGTLKPQGAMNGFIFKPVIRASNLSTAGRIEGLVADTAKVKVKSAKVWIAQDTIVATAIADTMGFYGLIGIPAGSYKLYAHKEGYDTVKYTGIEVLAGNKTLKNVILTKK
jgi:hypothetical protein